MWGVSRIETILITLLSILNISFVMFGVRSVRKCLTEIKRPIVYENHEKIQTDIKGQETTITDKEEKDYIEYGLYEEE